MVRNHHVLVNLTEIASSDTLVDAISEHLVLLICSLLFSSLFALCYYAFLQICVVHVLYSHVNSWFGIPIIV